MAIKSIYPSLEVEKSSSNDLKKKVEAHRKEAEALEKETTQSEEYQLIIQKDIIPPNITKVSNRLNMAGVFTF
jgi:hypothetical protein